MRVLSSPSSSNPNFAFFSTPSPNPSAVASKLSSSRSALKPTLLCSNSRELAAPVMEQEARVSDPKARNGNEEDVLRMVRRPVMEAPVVEEEVVEVEVVEEEEEADGDLGASSAAMIDATLTEIAKKMPMFEPGRVRSGTPENRPLKINLDLALYRAKVLGRQFRYGEAAEKLRKCISLWPEDGRSYVSFGKMLVKQSKFTEARAIYEQGCQATQGENPYIWQCWAVMEKKAGNIRKARELFDAATVADKKHIASWHGWAVLELQQGNVKKARQLLGKGLKFCGGNEYIYQTLALLEAKADRREQARYLFKQATQCNPKSCASWLAWAQLEARQENYRTARRLFEKAIQSSPKNKFAWHIWGVFEVKAGNIEKGRKILTIGHALNPWDAVLLQSLALLEYNNSTADLARVLFRRASEIDPRHQPIWIAWGWMEWKEGNVDKAREYYQRTLSIDSTNDGAARCLQAWGVLEQKLGNVSAARRLFRSSLNINSQSYVTWMTWASMEENEGNPIRAEEIRNLYYQQRTEVVDDASWIMGFLDIIDPALERIKKLLKMDRDTFKGQDPARYIAQPRASIFEEDNDDDADKKKLNSDDDDGKEASSPAPVDMESGTGFDLDAFVKKNLALNPSNLDKLIATTIKSPRVWIRSKNRSSATTSPQPSA